MTTPENTLAGTRDAPGRHSGTSSALDVPGFVNLRDVGGLPAGPAARTRWRALLRADWPALTGPSGVRALHTVPVRTVIDLRDDEEVLATEPLFREAGFTVLRRPIFDGSAASFVARGVTLTDLYRHMVRRSAAELAGAVAAVADAGPGGVLVHCTAGKDRTGLTVALALSAVGVPREDVVRDYAATEARLRGPWLARRVAELVAYHGAGVALSAELLAGSPAGAIESALDLVVAGWGSVPAYLAEHGVSEKQLARLRTRLILDR